MHCSERNECTPGKLFLILGIAGCLGGSTHCGGGSGLRLIEPYGSESGPALPSILPIRPVPSPYGTYSLVHCNR